MTDAVAPVATALAVSRRAAAEALGTALLLAAVVGSGIMAERLAGGNPPLALLANSIATRAPPGALILAFRPVSRAPFNPVVTRPLPPGGAPPWRHLPADPAAQAGGAGPGAALVGLAVAVGAVGARRGRAGGVRRAALVAALVCAAGCQRRDLAAVGGPRAPLVLLVSPSHAAGARPDELRALGSLLGGASGLAVEVRVAATPEAAVQAFGRDEADAGLLSLFEYLLARQEYGVDARLQVLRDGGAA